MADLERDELGDHDAKGQEPPILADLMQWFIDPDLDAFHQDLREITTALRDAADPVRQKLVQDGEILQAQYVQTDAKIGAIDSASVPVPLGEVFTIVSLAVHYSPYHRPKFVANRKTGYNNEAYRHLAVGLRLHGELKLMAETDHITIADNSWWSYLMDTNKLITAYQNLAPDEREPFEQLYEEVTQPSNGYFIRSILSSNIVAMSKTGSSQATCKRRGYSEFFSKPVSDLALFSHILLPGEYTKPYPLKFMTDASFGVEQRGWTPQDAKRISERYSDRDGLNVLFFKPWPYKKAFRIEFGYETFGDNQNLQTLLTVIRDDTQHHTIVEPVSQLFADRLAKQVSAISRMYGSINTPVFSDILFPTRTPV